MRYDNFKRWAQGKNIFDIAKVLSSDEQVVDHHSKRRIFEVLDDIMPSHPKQSVLKDKDFRFLNGFVFYIERLITKEPFHNYVDSSEPEYNFYSAHIQQVISSLNHILSIISNVELDLKENYINFQHQFRRVILKIDVRKENLPFREFISSYVDSPYFLIAQKIRNELVHMDTNPNNKIDMAFLLHYVVYEVCYFIFWLKLVYDGSLNSGFELKKKELLKYCRKASQKFNRVSEEWDRMVVHEYGLNTQPIHKPINGTFHTNSHPQSRIDKFFKRNR